MNSFSGNVGTQGNKKSKQRRRDLDVVVVVVEKLGPVGHHVGATAGEDEMDHVTGEGSQLK